MSERIRQGLRELSRGLPHRDLTEAVLRRHRRRRVREGVAVAALGAVVLAGGGWVAMAAPLPTASPDPVASPPPVTSPAPPPSPSSTPDPARLTGTFYYYRRTGGDQEQVWVWTVGQAPRPLAEIGAPEDVGWGYYAWHTAAITADGAWVAWRPRGADPVVVNTATGDRETVDAGDADLGCLPAVWHPHGGARLLVRRADGSAGWQDVASGRWDPIGADLSQACAATVFTIGPDTVAFAYQDLDTESIVAVTEAGAQLWRIDVNDVDERLAPMDGLWQLVDVADGGGHVCLNIMVDVAGGAGGLESTDRGQVVVDTATGAVVADGRPDVALCEAVTAEGYLARFDGPDGMEDDGASQHLRLTGYDGTLLSVVDEPPALDYQYLLIGYVPAPR